jgi:hypothetical protein
MSAVSAAMNIPNLSQIGQNIWNIAFSLLWRAIFDGDAMASDEGFIFFGGIIKQY